MNNVSGAKRNAKKKPAKPRTPKEGLDYLRKVLPEFDARCALYVEKMLFLGEQRRIVRAGYDKLRFYKTKQGNFLPWDMPFTDADHVFHLVNSVIMFKDFFGEYIPWLYGFQPQWLDIVEEMVFHEIGETRIGDWPDDGSRDTAEKDRLEQEVVDEFMVGFPGEAQRNHQRQFAAVRDGIDIGKLFDKQGFLNGIAYAKVHGFEGDVYACENLSGQDNGYRKKVQSDRCFDLVYSDMLTKYRDHPFLPFFMGINEAIYSKVFVDNDPRVKGCVAGEPPPGVKKLYL